MTVTTPSNGRPLIVHAVVVADSATAKPGYTPDITVLKELTPAQHKQVYADAVTVQQYDRSNLLPYVELNHRALEGTVEKYTTLLSGKLSFDVHVNVAPMQIELTCGVLNWLSSMRMQLDQSEHAISQKHGRKSRAFESFGEAQRWEFENVFAYRFLSKLRNHVQHQDLRIHTSGASGKLDDVTGELVTQIDFAFDRDTLLEAKRWGVVVNDLRVQPEQFAVMPVLEEGLLSLRRLAEEASRHLHPDIVEAAERMEALRLLARASGKPAFLGRLEDVNGQMRHAELSPLDLTQTIRVRFKLGLATT